MQLVEKYNVYIIDTWTKCDVKNEQIKQIDICNT